MVGDMKFSVSQCSNAITSRLPGARGYLQRKTTL